MPRYHPEQYPLTLAGSELSSFTNAGVTYRHFHFNHFPWPARYGQTMHVFVPAQPDAEAVFMNSPADLYASEYRGKTNIPAHYIYKGGRVIALQVPRDSIEHLDKAAMLIVTKPRQQMSAYTGTVSTIVHLTATKSGPSSEVTVGMVDQGGKVVWGKRYVLNDAPYQWQWFSPLYYGYYAVAVPFDILTFPIQLPIYGFYYVMGRGMSPR